MTTPPLDPLITTYCNKYTDMQHNQEAAIEGIAQAFTSQAIAIAIANDEREGVIANDEREGALATSTAIAADGEPEGELALVGNKAVDVSTEELPFEVVLPRESSCASGTCSRRAAMEQPEVRYRPLHRELFGTRFRRDWLAEPFASAYEERSAAARRVAIKSLLRTEVEGRVWSFEMVKPEFCSMFLDELLHYEASGNPIARPNSMNNYGVIVNQIGMKDLIDDLQLRYVQPLASMLFPTEGEQFTGHHSFMVQYKQGEDLGLDMHHDDSDVTLNVCLGKDFTGATLSFCGGFGLADHRKHVHTYKHEKGRAIIHLGSHRHGADDIATGERYSLIVWNHNGPWRESDEYKALHTRNLHGADALGEEPDPICLSYTHDPDFGEHKVA